MADQAKTAPKAKADPKAKAAVPKAKAAAPKVKADPKEKASPKVKKAVKKVSPAKRAILKAQKAKKLAGKKVTRRLPVVPESWLKLRKMKNTQRPNKVLAKRRVRAVKLLRRKQNLLRAARYEKKYLKTMHNVTQEARIAKAKGNIYIPAEPKVAFVIRIRG